MKWGVMDRMQAIEALKATGIRLEQAGVVDGVTVALGGAVAAMITAGLPASRVTHDCDVLASEPDEKWQAVQQAACEVAGQRGLPTDWLNRDARMYAHLLPLGWRDRCQAVGQFGPLTVLAISRLDLMAMKLMGAAVRPQDLEDIMAMQPMATDITFLHDHLNRLNAESLTGEQHAVERAILLDLEKRHEQD